MGAIAILLGKLSLSSERPVASLCPRSSATRLRLGLRGASRATDFQQRQSCGQPSPVAGRFESIVGLQPPAPAGAVGFRLRPTPHAARLPPAPDTSRRSTGCVGLRTTSRPRSRWSARPPPPGERLTKVKMSARRHSVGSPIQSAPEPSRHQQRPPSGGPVDAVRPARRSGHKPIASSCGLKGAERKSRTRNCLVWLTRTSEVDRSDHEGSG